MEQLQAHIDLLQERLAIQKAEYKEEINKLKRDCERYKRQRDEWKEIANKRKRDKN